MRTPDIAEQRHKTDDTTGPKLIETVTLSPGEGRGVVLGIYEEGMCEPTFDLRFDPPTDVVVGDLIKTEEKDGDYKLIYYLQNFSRVQSCQVEIRERCVGHE
ncbi:hypothetical protein Acsp03_71320 [Actinomadura sp. NBRC 104412]|uniref:hypothetical protein n=1 Tax=Actinomadura sp. NBRC 104412 TaxID=3032203 RepID=UPI0024A5D912|nr:hypothetical protein [Actinomadura sp. NBRC 104412]GLZ09666.1 hypothetical protein Acsp03_71320 [Actinomadura sp. NBRC 104412]